MSIQIDAAAAKKARTHTIYKTGDGTRVPGVTTVLGVLAKPGLVPWANKLGLAGIDVATYVDDLAVAGTCAHYLIQCHLTQATPDLAEYSKDQIDRAENAFLKFLEWEARQRVETRFSEIALVSEVHRFGGSVDWYGRVDGVPTLIDFKTSKALYLEHYVQTCAYRALLLEHGHPVAQVRVLRVGRTEDEGFEEHTIGDSQLQPHFDLFLKCLEVYRLKQQLERGSRR